MTAPELSDDEKHLASLGYKQELNRSWSGFSNFAISFSIISILAGCFTSFGLGWNNGGPAAIAWGWPLISAFILAIAAVVNIFSSHLLAIINNVSVWWHVAGAAVVIVILFLVPDHHASFSDVFAQTINNSGLFDGETSGAGWLFFVLPISAILTQYTITGYDASAHLSEETKSAAGAAAKGIWRSIFYSAIGGW